MRLLGIASTLVAASGFTNPSLLRQAVIAPTSKLAPREIDARRTRQSSADHCQSIIANVTLGYNDDLNSLLTGANEVDRRRIASSPNIMRPPPDPYLTSWAGIKNQLISNFNIDRQDLENYSAEFEDTAFLLKVYRSMQLSRQFEIACNKEYMLGKVRE